MLEQYKSGFKVNGDHPIETVEWIFEQKESTEEKLIFQAYDANLYPLPDLSTWKNEEWRQKQIATVLVRTKNFSGEIWLDDVKIK